MFNRDKPEVQEDEITFARRIRSTIEDRRNATTNGIQVFEHNDELTLDEQEREVLEKLRAAHEKWHTNSETSKSEHDDAYKSVKVRI